MDSAAPEIDVPAPNDVIQVGGVELHSVVDDEIVAVPNPEHPEPISIQIPNPVAVLPDSNEEDRDSSRPVSSSISFAPSAPPSPSSSPSTPSGRWTTIAFVNSRSGVLQGTTIFADLVSVLGADCVYQLHEQDPSTVLRQRLCGVDERLRVLICGGDGTVGWILESYERIFRSWADSHKRSSFDSTITTTTTTTIPNITTSPTPHNDLDPPSPKRSDPESPTASTANDDHGDGGFGGSIVPLPRRSGNAADDRRLRRFVSRRFTGRFVFDKWGNPVIDPHRIVFCIIPIGTGNDFSRAMGWGKGIPTNASVLRVWQRILDEHSLHRRVERVDRWHVSVTEVVAADGSQPRVVKEFSFQNYMSIGIDAKIQYEFEQWRQKHEFTKSTSRVRNMFQYFLSGVASTLTSRTIGKNLKISVDGKSLNVPLDVKAICFPNINSYGAGQLLWLPPSARETRKKGFRAQRHDDNILEVVGIFGPVHLAGIQTNVRGGDKIGQGHELEIAFQESRSQRDLAAAVAAPASHRARSGSSTTSDEVSQSSSGERLRLSSSASRRGSTTAASPESSTGETPPPPSSEKNDNDGHGGEYGTLVRTAPTKIPGLPLAIQADGEAFLVQNPFVIRIKPAIHVPVVTLRSSEPSSAGCNPLLCRSWCSDSSDPLPGEDSSSGDDKSARSTSSRRWCCPRRRPEYSDVAVTETSFDSSL